MVGGGKRIAITLSAEDRLRADEVAARYDMTPAAFSAYCVKFYLSRYGDGPLQPLPRDPQGRLDV